MATNNSWLSKLFYSFGSLLSSFREGNTGKRKTRAKVFDTYLNSMAAEGRYGGMGSYNLSYQEMAQRRAIQDSWLFTAISLIAKEASAADFHISEKDEEGEYQEVGDHPFLDILKRPNPHMGRSYMWMYSYMWLELSGNFYWFITTDSSGKIVEIWPLPSHEVEPIPGDTEKIIAYYEYRPTGRIYQIPSEFICHVRLPNPFDIFRGMSPLVAAINAVDTDMAMAMWNNNFFNRDNIMPSSIINITSGDPNVPIDEADIAMLKEDLREDYAAFRRRTAIMTAGTMQVEKLEWSPFELDFKGSRQFSKDEIFSVYGIPTGLLDGNGSVGITRADQIFKEKTVWPTLVLAAEQITAQIIMPYYGRDLQAEFDDIRPVNRQLELQEISSARDWLTIDEIRKKYWKLEPLPNNRGNRLMSESSQSLTSSSTSPSKPPPNGSKPPSSDNLITLLTGQPADPATAIQAQNNASRGAAAGGQASLAENGYPSITQQKPPAPPKSDTPLERLVR